MAEFEKAEELPDRPKAEIEQFFLSTTAFTDKDAFPLASIKVLRASIKSWDSRGRRCKSRSNVRQALLRPA